MAASDWKHPRRVRLLALAVVWAGMIGIIVLMPVPMLKYACVPLLLMVAFGAVVWENARHR